MLARPTVIETVYRAAREGLGRQSVPDDVTVQEEAEGLILLAMGRLRCELAADVAVDAANQMVSKYRGD
jgi:hypothetical protein